MVLEAFIGDELRRIQNEHHRRIDPLIASFLSTHRTAPKRAFRARAGAVLIRAGARLAGSQVAVCPEESPERAASPI